MNTAPMQPFLFLDLSTELRLMVYDDPPSSTRRSAIPTAEVLFKTTKVPTALLATRRLIQLEVDRRPPEALARVVKPWYERRPPLRGELRAELR